MAEDVSNDDLEFEDRLARQQRRKLIAGVVIGSVVVAAGVLVYFLWPKRPDPRCKDKDVQVFLSQSEIPTSALHRVCDFPKPLADALRGMASAPPHFRKLLLLKAVAEDRSLVTGVCPNAPAAIAEATREIGAKHAEIYLQKCDLAKKGIASADALAGRTLAQLVLATAIYGALKDSDPRWAKRLAREACCSGRR